MAQFIDTHVHFWRVADGTHAWIDNPAVTYPLRYGSYDAIRIDYLPANYLADAAPHEIAAVVHMEAIWDPRDPVGETRWLSQLRQQTGLPTVAVAFAALDREDVKEALAAHAGFDFVRGIRQVPAAAPSVAQAVRGAAGSLDDPAFRDGYARLADYQFSFDLQTRIWHYDAVADLARDFPATTIILNHAGMLVDRHPDTMAAWRQALESVAIFPNVVMKISGIGIAGERWSLARNRHLIADAIAIFGVERCLFGSNFPVDRLIGNLADIFDGFAESISGFDAAQRHLLLVGNARRIYRIAE